MRPGVPQSEDPKDYPLWDFNIKMRGHLDYDKILEEKIMNSKVRYDGDNDQDDEDDEDDSLKSYPDKQPLSITTM